MILSRQAIQDRLSNGQVLKQGTWVKESIKEASYALRVAPDGLILEGKRYRPGKDFVDGNIEIKPGAIAIFSTLERLNMPGDLVGKLGIRFDYASQGLTGLMGIQVDPFFGWGHDNERLYIRVANLGNDPVSFCVGTEVFSFELHAVEGNVPIPSSPRVEMWLRLQEVLGDQTHLSWSYVTSVQHDLQAQGTRLDGRLEEIRDYLQPLVMFGIFLVAVTILGVALSVIVSGYDIPQAFVPSWVKDWGWALLLFTLCIATTTTALMGGLTAWRLLKRG